MVECGGHARLEAPARGGVGQLGGEELDGHGPVQLRIEGAIDRAHSALADFRFDAVVAELEPRADRGLRRHGDGEVRSSARQQRVNLTPQFCVVMARPIEKRTAFLGLALLRGAVQALDSLPAVGVH